MRQCEALSFQARPSLPAHRHRARAVRSMCPLGGRQTQSLSPSLAHATSQEPTSLTREIWPWLCVCINNLAYEIPPYPGKGYGCPGTPVPHHHSTILGDGQPDQVSWLEPRQSLPLAGPQPGGRAVGACANRTPDPRRAGGEIFLVVEGIHSSCGLRRLALTRPWSHGSRRQRANPACSSSPASSCGSERCMTMCSLPWKAANSRRAPPNSATRSSLIISSGSR